MKRVTSFLYVLVCGLTLLPAVTFAASTAETQQLLESLQAQIAALQQQLAAAQDESGSGVVVPTLATGWQYDRLQYDLFAESEIQEELLTDDYDVKTYLVRNDRLYENYQWTKNTKTDSYRIWSIYADILGDEWVAENIRQYNTYRDPDGSLYGFVWRMRKESPSWGFAVDISRSDFTNPEWVRDMIIVMLHEAAHIVTLNNKQVLAKVQQAKYCLQKKGFFTGSECAQKDSYLKDFGKKFWSDKEFVSFYNKVQDYEKQKRTKALRAYYKKHPDEFVTAYALKSPEEDIAESFVNFILEDRPVGKTVREQKIAFFYQYPELVARRKEIRNRIEAYFVQ